MSPPIVIIAINTANGLSYLGFHPVLHLGICLVPSSVSCSACASCASHTACCSRSGLASLRFVMRRQHAKHVFKPTR